jgi:diaminohydroxyphosphoribosylaminopyrimidine deaminase / 5-amino-6-(5-phosphoribosylamino)uracil reductase
LGVALNDEASMAAALALGEQGRLTAPPNPWVGCVLVRDGALVGQGFHRAPGEAHAEVVALAEAAARARGATAVVTLEPCSHFGRTPPCASALLEAGVSRVVVALLDPDPRVSGRGVARLREAGVAVDVGVGADAAAVSLAPYLHHRRTGWPLCVLKAAISLDGRTAAADGTSQWITGPEARADAHRLRSQSQAVMVGAGTALADQPRLTARGVDPPAPAQPLRVLLDSRGRVPAEGPLFDPRLAATLVVTTALAAPEAVKAWLEAGADVEEVPLDAGGAGVDLAATLELLGQRGVLQVLVEGGAALHASLVRAGLADRLVLYLGGCLLGEAGRPLLAGPGPATIGEAWPWRITASRPFGPDLRLDCQPADVSMSPTHTSCGPVTTTTEQR